MMSNPTESKQNRTNRVLENLEFDTIMPDLYLLARKSIFYTDDSKRWTLPKTVDRNFIPYKQ